jgi:hypothetical protein
MVNRCESQINAVTLAKPKMLRGLNQNGTWIGRGSERFPLADVVPPASWRNLTYSGTHTQRGKPVSLPVAGKRVVRRADGDAGMG